MQRIQQSVETSGRYQRRWNIFLQKIERLCTEPDGSLESNSGCFVPILHNSLSNIHIISLFFTGLPLAECRGVSLDGDSPPQSGGYCGNC